MLLEHRGKSPKIHDSVYIAPTATVCGDVTIGENTSVLFGAVITADGGPVTIGKNCIIMENAVIRGTRKQPAILENNILVGPRSYLTGCAVKDNVFLATGSTVFNGATIEERSEVRINGVVHINTRVTRDSTVPIGWVAVGDPCRILPPEEHDQIWKIQKDLDFPGTVWGVDRPGEGESIMPDIARRYSHYLAGHRSDRAVPRAGLPGSEGEEIDASDRSGDATLRFHTVSYEKTGDCARITMDRPEKLNALNMDMWTGLLEAMLEAKTDPQVRVVILNGKGRAFSAGDDIEMMNSWKPGEAQIWMKQTADPFIFTLFTFPKPVIAVVDGIAAGGGCEVLMMCDIVVATTRSVFSIPEGRIGAVPPVAASFGAAFLNKKILRYALTGRSFDSYEAANIGIVDVVVEPNLLAEKVEEILQELHQVAPLSMQKIKSTFNFVKQRYLSELEEGKKQLVDIASSNEFVERQRSFFANHQSNRKDQ